MLTKGTGLKSVAVVGAGGWGKNIIRNFYELEVLHTICDIDASLLLKYHRQYSNIHFTTDLDDILNNPVISQVAIASPTPTHYRIAKRAILAGKDVYVEKPLCLDFQEGEELVRLAEEHGRILMVGHILHYHPAVRKMQELVSEQELGQLQYIASNRLNIGSIKANENALWDLATHDVSVILSLFDYELPLQVRCVGGDYSSDDKADVAVLTMEFANRGHCHIYFSWLNPFKEQKMTIIGTNGGIVFDDMQPWTKKLSYFKGDWPSEISLNDMYEVECMEQEPLREECKHFLDCSRNRLMPKTGGEDALSVLRVLQAAQESFNENGNSKSPALIESSEESLIAVLTH